MKNRNLRPFMFVTAALFLGACLSLASAQGDDTPGEDSLSAESEVDFILRSRAGGTPGEASCVASHEKETFDMNKTAIVVVDMWTTHWCKRMTESGRQLAPKINDFITEARRRGATIVHCPSGGTGHHKDHPATANMADIPMLRSAPNGHTLRGWNRQLDSEPYTMMIDRTPLAGCPCQGKCKNKMDTRQLAAIKIHDDDYITASGHKLLGLLVNKEIKHVLYTGAAIERCVLGRPFGMRHMTAAGFDTHMVRDLVDGMHLYPWMRDVPHSLSNQMSLEHVERFIAPTVISASLLDSDNQEKLSREAVDNKPSLQLAFTAEGTLDGLGTYRLYSKVGTDLYECVGFTKGAAPAEYQFDLASVLKENELDARIVGVQLLLTGREVAADWAITPTSAQATVAADENCKSVVLRITLQKSE